MKRFAGFVLILFCLTLIAPLSAQDEPALAIGDYILVVSGILPVHIQPDDTSPVATEVLPGMKSIILGIQQDKAGQTWFYLENNAFGWVQSTTSDGEATMDTFSDERLEQLRQSADAAIETNPQDRDAYITRATVFLTERDYDQSSEDYRSALRLDPDNGSMMEYLGKSYMDAGRYDTAFAFFTQALGNGSAMAGTYNRIGIVVGSQGQYTQSLGYYEQAIRLVPDWGLIYSNMSYAYRKKSDYDTAMDYVNQALEKDPLLAIAYNNRGWIYRELNDAQAAEEAFNQALVINPKNADTYVALGTLYSEVYRDYQTALTDYNTAIDLEPENDWAYSSRAVTYMYTGNADGAIADLKYALKLNPHNDNTYYNLASLYGSLGRYNEALESYNQAIDLVGSDYSLASLLYRPQIDVALDDYHNALIDLNNYISHFGQDGNYFAAAAYLIRASIRVHEGDYEFAADDYQQAFTIQRAFAQGYHQYGAGYRVTPQREYLIFDLQAQIAQNPKQADLYLQLANLDMEFGRWQEAIDTYQQYLDLSPDSHVEALLQTLKSLIQ